MDLRQATRSDLDAIQRVAERSWTVDYPDFTSRESVTEGVHEWYSDARLEAEIDRGDAAVLVAERAGEIVGFTHAAWSGDEGDVMRVYVDPDHRGQGVGSALLESAVATLFERDVAEVRAMVLADNDPGNEFYRSHGFEREEETHETRIADEFYDEHVWKLAR
ncbi:N-acetyltransferase [Halobacteriales archaeon QS_1_68_20]|nr:MAG: N-acetyltransferase [Halobacteriales archaeon QS_1_68_20]